MALLIDTTVFVALERRREAVADLAAGGVVGADEYVAVAAITASELLVGVYRARTPEQRHRREAFVEALLARIPVLAFDAVSARIHARLAVDLGAVGARIGAHDLLIAATALQYGCAVLTENVREFTQVPGLQVKALA
jgi:tRNA(fMet)-specific endonuclease VapC